jgi:hypothetical protein
MPEGIIRQREKEREEETPRKKYKAPPLLLRRTAVCK